MKLPLAPAARFTSSDFRMPSRAGMPPFSGCWPTLGLLRSPSNESLLLIAAATPPRDGERGPNDSASDCPRCRLFVLPPGGMSIGWPWPPSPIPLIPPRYLTRIGSPLYSILAPARSGWPQPPSQNTAQQFGHLAPPLCPSDTADSWAQESECLAEHTAAIIFSTPDGCDGVRGVSWTAG